MKHIAVAAALAAFALPLLADWNVHVNIGSPPCYGYAPAEVVYVERYVPAHDVPLVFVAPRHARMRPVIVVEAHRAGGWGLVCSRFGVPRHVLFAPAGPPPLVIYSSYGPPHPKHYRKALRQHRRDWR
jgi:hypothetical protein